MLHCGCGENWVMWTKIRKEEEEEEEKVKERMKWKKKKGFENERKETERKREQKKRKKKIKEGENSIYDELGYWYPGEFVFEGRSLKRCLRTPSPSNNFEGMEVLNFVRSQLPPSERRPRDSETDPKDNLTNRRRRLCLGWCGSSLGETTESNWNPGIPSATSSGHGPLILWPYAEK